jgi:hypothetical protein
MFGHRSFFFHVVISLVQLLITAYDETFQSLVVEETSKPLLDVGFDGVRSRWPRMSFFQFVKQWQSGVAKSRLCEGWRTRCQWQVCRGKWVVWTVLGQAISCGGSTLVRRPGPWRRVGSLGVETSPYSHLESPSHHASWYLRKRSREYPRVCCHHLTVV